MNSKDYKKENIEHNPSNSNMFLDDEDPFRKWYREEASEDERALVEKIYSFSEEFFDDMLFREGSSVGDFIEIEEFNKDGEWIPSMVNLPLEVSYNRIPELFTYSITELPPREAARVDSEKMIVSFSPQWWNDDEIVLHEMIHMYELTINKFSSAYHDVLLWSLFLHLRDRIPDLEEIIHFQAHMLIQQEIQYKGGTHDLLFLLKSFDLDIRRNLPLGSHFGYEREEWFERYSYTLPNQ